MKLDLSQFRQTFLQESADHVATMETELLALRSSPSDSELLNSIFRSAHSIKGGAGSFGMTALVHFTHSLENLLDRLRSDEMQATERVIEVLLQSVDIVRSLLGGSEELSEEGLALNQEIDSIVNNGDVTERVIVAPKEQAQQQERQIDLYRVEFVPSAEIFESGTNPIVLLRNLASLGTVSCCHLHSDNLPSLAELDPSKCYLSWTVELATVNPESDLHEVFEFVEHLAEIHIECLSKTAEVATLSATEPNESTEAPVAQETAAVSAVASSQPPVAATARKTEANNGSASIRVAIEKVDRLIDLVGELAIAHVMTAQMVEHFDPTCLPKLREAVAAMERNTRELHEHVMSVRMLPVGMLFQRYPRVIYDIAQSTGKQIRLEMSGEDTEIDRGMLEALGDPLIHLVRNSADHGIEDAETRKSTGKAEEGLITLRAFHRSGRIVIEISDDGAGIDIQRVRQKAIERGLISANAELSDDQLRMLIFEPGFSTREQISNLSGRGVGMDVVKRNVQQLSGTVSVSSELGKGTTVSIELPLTLAILEGLLVRIADRTLVLPLLSVIETVPLPESSIVRIAGKGEVVVIREEPVPLLFLCRFLGLSRESAIVESTETSSTNRKLAVIVETGHRKIGLVVDELLGQQQVVVKSLERHLRKVDGLMGATILGDGCVAPIIDVNGISNLNLFAL